MTIPSPAVQTPKMIFLANWSGCYSLEHSLPVFDKLLEDCNPSSGQCYIALPYSYLAKMPEKYHQSGLILGADTVLSMEEGAFTEAIAIKLLKNAKAKFALLRGDDSIATVPKKIKAAVQGGLTPFLCIGEAAPEKLSLALQDISPHQLINLNIVYEAPWINLLPYQPSLEQLVDSYRQFREALQSQVGIQIANGMRLICAVPHDFEDLPALVKEGGVNGLYLSKAIFHQNQLHRMFASDLHLHGDYELPVIEEKPAILEEQDKDKQEEQEKEIEQEEVEEKEVQEEEVEQEDEQK